MNSFLVSALIALIVVLVPFVRWVRQTYRLARMDAQMKLTAERAVQSAGERALHLDYSTDSIKEVEEILKTLHERYIADPSSVNAGREAARYGAYIGEAIRRSDPNCKDDPNCSWQRDHEVAGPNSYPLRWRDGDLFPIGWCYKRIVDGDEDNVWVKYRLFADQLARKTTTTAS